MGLNRWRTAGRADLFPAAWDDIFGMMWGRQSAALAYYLLFTLFPFLIFLSSLLGLLHLDVV